MTTVQLKKEQARALAALRRAPFYSMLRSMLHDEVERVRREYEAVTPADEEARLRVVEAKALYGLLFEHEIEVITDA